MDILDQCQNIPEDMKAYSRAMHALAERDAKHNTKLLEAALLRGLAQGPEWFFGPRKM